MGSFTVVLLFDSMLTRCLVSQLLCNHAAYFRLVDATLGTRDDMVNRLAVAVHGTFEYIGVT